MQVGATVGHAEHSGDLRRFIEQGKKIIVTTVQKFPWVLDEIGTVADKRFVIVIDEAHSGQGGKTSAAVSQTLGKALGEGADAAADGDDERDAEDVVNAALEARMASCKRFCRNKPVLVA
jgi:type I restriction enzyme R subunit